MFAVIKTGGKQYIVSPGQKIKIEKIEQETGTTAVFNDVLLVSHEDKTEVGNPLIKGVSVQAKIIRQFRTKKIIVFKYHSKTRYHKKAGHRQEMTEVEIEKIISG